MVTFAQQVFETQHRAGGCAVVRHGSAIAGIAEIPSVETIRGGLCTHPGSRKDLQPSRPSWWATNCAEIAAELRQECSIVTDQGGRGSWFTRKRRPAAVRTLRGLKRYLSREEPERFGRRKSGVGDAA